MPKPKTDTVAALKRLEERIEKKMRATSECGQWYGLNVAHSYIRSERRRIERTGGKRAKAK